MKVGSFEQKVYEVDGIRVIVRSFDSRDIKSNCKVDGLSYPFMRQSKGSLTIRAWKEKRFRNCVGLRIQVVDRNRRPIPENTLVSQARKMCAPAVVVTRVMA